MHQYHSTFLYWDLLLQLLLVLSYMYNLRSQRYDHLSFYWRQPVIWLQQWWALLWLVNSNASRSHWLPPSTRQLARITASWILLYLWARSLASWLFSPTPSPLIYPMIYFFYLTQISIFRILSSLLFLLPPLLQVWDTLYKQQQGWRHCSIMCNEHEHKFCLSIFSKRMPPWHCLTRMQNIHSIVWSIKQKN